METLCCKPYFPSLISHRTGLQLEWQQCSWGHSLNTSWHFIDGCGQGQPCSGHVSLGFQPGDCAPLPPLLQQITLVASQTSGRCVPGALFHVLVAARLVQTALAELCWSLPRQGCRMPHSNGWFKHHLFYQLQDRSIKLRLEGSVCLAKFSV